MGRATRVEFTGVVKKEIHRRAEVTGARRCENCGILLKRGEGQIDHKTPEWTWSATKKEDRRRLTADDGWLLCGVCHQIKTGAEATVRGHVDRMGKRHSGKHKAKRPFSGWRNFKGQIVWSRLHPRKRPRGGANSQDG